MKRLKRKWARVCTVLMVLTILCVFLPWVMYDLLGRSIAWAIAGVTGATLGLTAMLIVKFVCLRCPNCGKSAARPQWKPGTRYYCPCCGKPFVYDDEPEEMTED